MCGKSQDGLSIHVIDGPLFSVNTAGSMWQVCSLLKSKTNKRKITTKFDYFNWKLVGLTHVHLSLPTTDHSRHCFAH